MKLLTILVINIVFLICFNVCNALNDVIGIGIANIDIFVECSDDQELQKYTQDTVKKGDSGNVDDSFIHHIAATISSPIKKNPGGSSANVVAGIASLGGQSAIITARADDEFGKQFDHNMQKIGVKLISTIIDGGTTAFVYLFITKQDGERTIISPSGTYGKSAAFLINPDSITIDCIKNYQMLLTEGYMWYSQHTENLVTQAFKNAHQVGVKNVFSLGSQRAVQLFKEKFIQLLPIVDILVGNEEEFYALCDTTNLDATCKTICTKVPMAIITRAENGATIVTADKIIHVPIEHTVDRVIDTTGAGDIFLAGFLYGQTHDMSIQESAKLGNALAGKVIQHIGARPEFDTKEVLAILQHDYQNNKSINGF